MSKFLLDSEAFSSLHVRCNMALGIIFTFFMFTSPCFNTNIYAYMCYIRTAYIQHPATSHKNLNHEQA